MEKIFDKFTIKMAFSSNLQGRWGGVQKTSSSSSSSSYLFFYLFSSFSTQFPRLRSAFGLASLGNRCYGCFVTRRSVFLCIKKGSTKHSFESPNKVLLLPQFIDFFVTKYFFQRNKNMFMAKINEKLLTHFTEKSTRR